MVASESTNQDANAAARKGGGGVGKGKSIQIVPPTQAILDMIFTAVDTKADKENSDEENSDEEDNGNGDDGPGNAMLIVGDGSASLSCPPRLVVRLAQLSQRGRISTPVLV